MGKLYWNSPNPLGSGKGSIKLDDELPERYLSDKRLKKWYDTGKVSDVKNSDPAMSAGKIDKLIIENLELKSQIEKLTDQIKQLAEQLAKSKSGNKFLTDQIGGMRKNIDDATGRMMANEKVFSQMIELLGRDTIKKEDKTGMINTLTGLMSPVNEGEEEGTSEN